MRPRHGIRKSSRRGPKLDSSVRGRGFLVAAWTHRETCVAESGWRAVASHPSVRYHSKPPSSATTARSPGRCKTKSRTSGSLWRTSIPGWVRQRVSTERRRAPGARTRERGSAPGRDRAALPRRLSGGRGHRGLRRAAHKGGRGGRNRYRPTVPRVTVLTGRDLPAGVFLVMRPLPPHAGRIDPHTTYLLALPVPCPSFLFPVRRPLPRSQRRAS